MAVLPYRFSPAYDARELQSLFRVASVQAQQRHCPQILSLTLPLLPGVDPLHLLHHNPLRGEPAVYWENPSRGEAIAAIGQVEGVGLSGGDRFCQARQWLQTFEQHLIQGGDLDLPFSGVHTFAAFTFTPHRAPLGYAPAMLCVPQIQVARCGEQGVWVYNARIEPTTTLTGFLSQLAQGEALIQNLLQGVDFCPETMARPGHGGTITQTQHFPQFKQAVAWALEAIAAGKLSKIVMAHAVDLVSSQPFAVVTALAALRRHHPDCYTFAFTNAQGHSFIGASPERLIRIQGGMLQTDALAGSAPRGETPELDAHLARQLLTSDKERREHQAVSDYITQRLVALGLDPVRSPLQLRQLRQIQHLWTPITAPVPPSLHPLDIVAQLHPTPAVAGVPMAVACDHIQRYEGGDRGLYAAPIGWLNAQGGSEFIVGIRSALIRGQQARLYGGAGIVAGSDPERELGEIQLKLQTMLKALL
ncbi:isochorismate synthase [Spirulina sp. CCNP1310]|uniref:isochorismate synthase n=1 Tax=Spirulina sp. CCNP1310 TaxID=3110249 RepID=UPI002B2142AF|nr:isochorismate synthase [Spirulina sp. CCNP1310]MEA5418941.1 isochorismate synthase [Spirulina sp. CCNP1310]